MPELPDPRSVSADALHLWRLLAVRAVVDFEMPQADAAAQYGVSHHTMSQWVSLYREQDEAGLAVQPQGRPPGSGRTLSDDRPKRFVSSWSIPCRVTTTAPAPRGRGVPWRN